MHARHIIATRLELPHVDVEVGEYAVETLEMARLLLKLLLQLVRVVCGVSGVLRNHTLTQDVQVLRRQECIAALLHLQLLIMYAYMYVCNLCMLYSYLQGINKLDFLREHQLMAQLRVQKQ